MFVHVYISFLVLRVMRPSKRSHCRQYKIKSPPRNSLIKLWQNFSEELSIVYQGAEICTVNVRILEESRAQEGSRSLGTVIRSRKVGSKNSRDSRGSAGSRSAEMAGNNMNVGEISALFGNDGTKA